MAKNLTQLTARTATADSDLIHVNSGGTDYKQVKSDFLHGALTKTFEVTSTLTSQVDALPTDATYFGYIWNYGHVSATGMPINALSYVKAVKVNTNTFAFIEVWSATDPDGQHYIICKNNGTWESSWTKCASRSDLTKTYPTISKHANVTGDVIYITKIGYVVYISGYFKISATINTGQHLITFTGLTGQFQLQYIFIHNSANAISARLETSVNGSNPSLKTSSTFSDTSNYQYISAVLVST